MEHPRTTSKENKMATNTSTIKDEATEQFLKGRAKTEELGEQASVYVREKPLASLGIAFITGYVLSQLFSRK
jgi:ElaB/YqjD/DUF883 family membrane-anchored ribosome-binding protein